MVETCTESISFDMGSAPPIGTRSSRRDPLISRFSQCAWRPQIAHSPVCERGDGDPGVPRLCWATRAHGRGPWRGEAQADDSAFWRGGIEQVAAPQLLGRPNCCFRGCMEPERSRQDGGAAVTPVLRGLTAQAPATVAGAPRRRSLGGEEGGERAMRF